MKILAITSSYPRYAGDATAPFVESICRGVVDLGHEVHVLVPEHRAWSRASTEDGVHYHRYRYSPRRSWTPWGFSEALAGGSSIRKPLYALAPVVLASGTRAARRLLAQEPFDVVHVHWVVPNGPIGARASSSSGVPLVVSLHGSDVAVAERSSSIRRAARWSFARASAVTAPSHDLLERARAVGATGHLEAVPYGVDVEAFSSARKTDARRALGLGEAELVVAAVGRLIPVKGFRYLLDAHARVLDSVPDARLVLVGEGDQREELERQARELGIARAVTFAGSVGHAEIPGYLASADVVAVPSVRHGGYVDGLPNVALEAMAAGKPVVASRVGGLPDLVRDRDNGLLVEEKDPDALARAIVELALDPALRGRMGDAARHEMRTSRSWSAVAEQFVSVYEKARAHPRDEATPRG